MHIKLAKRKDLCLCYDGSSYLESDSGKSSLAQSPNYNLFGVKGSYNGESVNFNTLEAGSDNQMFSINAGFRKYPNLKSSLQDYADLIKMVLKAILQFINLLGRAKH